MRVALGSALAFLAALGCSAQARPGAFPGARSPALVRATGSGLGSLLRGPDIRPGGLLVTEPGGRLRTLELDDLAPLRARLSIPF